MAAGAAGQDQIVMPEDAAKLELIVVSLTRIETKLETVVGGHADHETRIRRLEQAKWTLVGAAALAGAIGGRIAGLL